MGRNKISSAGADGGYVHQVNQTLCIHLTVGLGLSGAGLTEGCAESDGSRLLPTMLPAAGAVLKSCIITTAQRQPFKSHSTGLPLHLSVQIAWSALLPVSCWPAASPSSPPLSRLHPLSGSAVPQVCRGAKVHSAWCVEGQFAVLTLGSV